MQIVDQQWQNDPAADLSSEDPMPVCHLEEREDKSMAFFIPEKSWH